MSFYSSLTGFWPLDEASGNRADGIGTNTLTDNNTVGSTTGLVYPTAANFVVANSEYLSHADDVALSMGDIDYWMAVWVRPSALPASNGTYETIISKSLQSLTRFEYMLAIENISSVIRFRFAIYNQAVTTFNDVKATTFGTPSINTWYFVLAYHDAVNNQIGIGVNNQFNTVSTTIQPVASATPFEIGRYAWSQNFYWPGRIGPVMIGKNYIPSSGKRTWLYNAGAGRTLAEIAAVDFLAGTASGSATSAGSLRGKAVLEGSATEAEATAQAFLRARSYVAGDAVAAASVTATLRGEGSVVGAIIGTASATGHIQSPVEISGISAGSAVVAGQVSAIGALSAAISVVGSMSGTLQSKAFLQATVAASVSVEATLKGNAAVNSVLSGDSEAQASIRAIAYIVGSSAGASTGIARPDSDTVVAGATQGQSLVTGLVHGKTNLVAAVSAMATADAFLGAKSHTEGVSLGSSVVVGVIVALGFLTGISSGNADSSGTLNRPIRVGSVALFTKMNAGMFKGMR